MNVLLLCHCNPALMQKYVISVPERRREWISGLGFVRRVPIPASALIYAGCILKYVVCANKPKRVRCVYTIDRRVITGETRLIWENQSTRSCPKLKISHYGFWLKWIRGGSPRTLSRTLSRTLALFTQSALWVLCYERPSRRGSLPENYPVFLER